MIVPGVPNNEVGHNDDGDATNNINTFVWQGVIIDVANYNGIQGQTEHIERHSGDAHDNTIGEEIPMLKVDPHW